MATATLASDVSPPMDDPTYKRRVAAFVGGLVADVAAMPLHWIYDTQEIAQILDAAGRTDTPEFLFPSHAPFYNYPVGEGTPFLEQTMIYSSAIAEQVTRTQSSAYVSTNNQWNGLDAQHVAG